MAIAFDVAGGMAITTGGGAVSLTLGGTATALVASVYYNPGGGTPTFTATWNGVDMTQVDSVDVNNHHPAMWDSGDLANILFYVLNPTTGNHSLSITENQSRPLGFSASSYSGVVSIGVSGALGNITAGTLTDTLTVSSNSWIVAGGTGNGTLAAGTGATERNSQNSAVEAIYDSNGPLSAGSNSLGITNSSNNGIASVSLELKMPEGATVTPRRTLLKVGI